MRLVLLALLAASPAAAQARPDSAGAPADTMPRVSFGGFIDSYYAWDFDRPSTFDRAYTTQPARHADFNVNLAFVDVKLAGPRYRGRLAMQFGTSVQSNYAGEPRIGSVSGPSVSQYIQEATLGYQLSPTVWIDGGVFFAHTGYESFISRDNLAYTRSLIADYSPYYEAGVKVTWTASAALTAQLDVVNGWQNISNYNSPPAAGIRVDYTVSPQWTVSYDNFVGDMAADSTPARVRFFNDFIVQFNPSAAWQLAGSFDIGTQSRSAPDGGSAWWYGTALFAKYHPTATIGVVVRVERYSDPDQVIVQTTLPYGFQTNGASLGVDVALRSRLLWRTELRGFRSTHPVWPKHVPGTYGRSDAVAVSSLALTL